MGMHTTYPNPLDPPQTISYENHKKSWAYFSIITKTFCSLLLQDDMAQAPPPTYAPD